MPYVRSQAAYADFIKGRDVDSALHREDGAAGYCIGIVSEARAGDEVITQQQYDSEKAATQSYNAAIPLPAAAPTPPDPDVELAAAISAVSTAGIVDVAAKKALDDLKAALLGSKSKGKVKGRPV